MAMTPEQKNARAHARQANQDRDRQAFSLRLQGQTFQQIADQLGLAVSSAHGAVQRYMASTLTITPQQVEEVRALELARLDRMQAALWPLAVPAPAQEGAKAAPADPVATIAILRLMAHRTRLMGLDREPMIDMEQELRRAARAEGLDEEEVVQEARALLRQHEPKWSRNRLRIVS